MTEPITAHQIDEVNKQIEIEHREEEDTYFVDCPYPNGGPSKRNVMIPMLSGENAGMTNEALLAIVIHRLQKVQGGDDSCWEYQHAIPCLFKALEYFKDRVDSVKKTTKETKMTKENPFNDQENCICPNCDKTCLFDLTQISFELAKALTIKENFTDDEDMSYAKGVCSSCGESDLFLYYTTPDSDLPENIRWHKKKQEEEDA